METYSKFLEFVSPVLFAESQNGDVHSNAMSSKGHRHK